MKIHVELENGLLPDRFGKFAPAELQPNGHPNRSFPIQIADIPAGTQSLALTFVDYDAIPVGGFCWIHWTACNIAPDTTLIPENNSITQEVPMAQGTNSDFSPLAGSWTDPAITQRYAGPYPPDATHDYTITVFALDTMLDLQEGFYLNQLRKAMRGHILAQAELELPSRSH